MKSNGKSIKQKPTAKWLGVTFDCNLTWNKQIDILRKPTYGVLRILKTFKGFTPFPTRKCLAESLVLSRIHYCNVVYSQMSNYLVKRLQQVQNCVAGYVLGRYANAVVVVNLNWLPILESLEYNINKVEYQGLNDKNWPSYLLVEIVTKKELCDRITQDHVLITVKNIHFKIKLRTLLINCQLIFDQMKAKIFLTGKQDIFIRARLLLGPFL